MAPDDIVFMADLDRAAYVPDDVDPARLTPDELYAADVAEEYRREALAEMRQG